MKHVTLKIQQSMIVLAALLFVLATAPVRAQGNQAMSFDVLGGLDLQFNGQCEIELEESSGKVTNLKVTDDVRLKIESSNLTLDCDLLLLDAGREVLIATGKKVNVVAEGRYITCQRLEYYMAENRFVLTGKPVIEQKDDKGNTTMNIQAEEIELISKDGKIKMFMKKGRVDATGDSAAGASPLNPGSGTTRSTPKPTASPTPAPTPAKTPDTNSKTPVVSE